MLSVEKVATPATAATVVVPDSVPPPGFTPIASATSPAKPEAVLPSESNVVTWIGESVAPAVVVMGCAVNTSWFTAPAATSKELLIASASPVAFAVRVKPAPLRFTLRIAKVATPATAATVRVPRRLAPTVPVPTVTSTVTLPVKSGTVLPNASRAVTTTAGLIGSPAIAAVGCVVKTSRLADPGVTVNAALVVPVSAGDVAASV